ncbi:MAG TPA: tRNA (adenosine(37)-N6)-dimethylallyltransferase MiaA [Rhodothermales bacterium]|nr:tRNA (adenosine(37)-N6)-dimethylallyltransferase MiaA [Rhodothermales bacterium]HRR09442.1 tRNA (adenosine(37)-N6)-dimethylallyltransferase MiaA [Rhodothermales bacterium]
MEFPRIQVFAGPTAVGKTAYAIEYALRNNGEIVSADSRQIFKELHIGTAKPSEAELRAVPHHFISEKNLSEPYSAGIFASEANARLADILAREKNPIVCGGSTLYLQALVYGLSEIPEAAPEVRNNLMIELSERGSKALFQELVLADPAYAQTLDPTKTQRLIRGLEVIRSTGKPISFFHQQQSRPPFTFDVTVLNRERKTLYERINLRVDQMLQEGLINEVQEILHAGFSPEINPLKTIGYQEPIAYLLGALSYEQMIALLKQHTRNYAKRQLTWFRRFEQQLLLY